MNKSLSTSHGLYKFIFSQDYPIRTKNTLLSFSLTEDNIDLSKPNPHSFKVSSLLQTLKRKNLRKFLLIYRVNRLHQMTQGPIKSPRENKDVYCIRQQFFHFGRVKVEGFFTECHQK